MSKIDLRVTKGQNYNDNSLYSLSFELQNNDTSAVSLSGIRIVGNFWSQSPSYSNLTSGIYSNGIIKQIVSASSDNSSQTGIVQLSNTQSVYRVNHQMIDSSKIAPIVTLNIPANGYYISPVSVTNRTDFYFDIILTEIPPSNNYSVSWFIPNTAETYSGITTAVDSPKISFISAAPSVRVDSRRSDSKFIIGWADSKSIPSNCALISANYYIKPTSGNFFYSSKPNNHWYSKLSDSTICIDDSFFSLEQWNGSAWMPVSEYNEYGMIDSGMVYGPTMSNQLTYISTSADYSVYIQSGSSNPLSANKSDKNILKLNSTGAAKARSLIKFNSLNIPTSATSVRNAVLRITTNAISNGWTYTGTSGNVSVHRITRDWNPSEATWTSATVFSPWASQGGDFEDSSNIWIGNTNLNNSFTSASSNSAFYVDVNVTDIVEYWRQNPSENYGFAVKLNPAIQENSISAVSYSINSSRSTSGTPTLFVAYNSPNSNGPVPNVTIESPSSNSSIINSCDFVVSTNILAGAVSDVKIYQQTDSMNNVYIGSLKYTSNNMWTGTLPLNVSATTIKLFARAESDLGVYGFSDIIQYTVVNVSNPIINPMGIFCYSDDFNVSGSYFQSAPNSILVEYSGNYIPDTLKINKIVEDKIFPNVIWFTTSNNGLWRYDPATGVAKNYNTQNSPILSDNIYAIATKYDGNIYIGCRQLDSVIGIGIVRFDGNNWNSFTDNDWEIFDKSNSTLTDFSNIDVSSIIVDSSDNVWFGFSWQTTQNILRMVGNNINSPFIQKYTADNSGINNMKYENGKLVVCHQNTSISLYSSASNNFSTITNSYSNARDISVDSSGNLWVCNDGGLSFYKTSTSAWTYANDTNTPAWPNGLNGNSTHFRNNSCNFIILSGTNKYFGFDAGNSNQYNGGLVKYTGTTFDLSATSSTNNWSVIDKDTTISFLSNKTKSGVITTNGTLWVSTDIGITKLNSVWSSPSKKKIIQTSAVSNGAWSSTISDIQYSTPINIDVKFDYDNYVLSASTILSAGRNPIITRVYPTQSDISIYSNDSKLFEFSVSGVDFTHGETATYEVYKSADNINWFLFDAAPVTKNITIYDTPTSGQSVWYYVNVVSNYGCSATSQKVLAYGNIAPTITISSQSSAYNTSTPATISGTFYDLDFGKTITINSSSRYDSVSAITVSSDKGYIGNANIVYQQTGAIPGMWNLIWNNPTASATKISATIYDTFGKNSTASSSISSVKTAPIITLLNPPTSGIFSYQANPVTVSATVFGTSNISAVDFYLSGTTSTLIGAASLSGSTWYKTFNVSAALSSFNNIGGTYGIFASAIDSNSLTAISEVHPISANNLPQFFLTNPVGQSCHSGTIVIEGNVSDKDNSNENLVEMYVGGTKITSAMTTAKKFLYSWTNPTTGIFDITFTTRDSALSADYSNTTYTLSAGQKPTITVYDNYTHGIKNDSTVIPYINVVGTSAIVSASSSSADSYSINYWYCDSSEAKTTLISANTTSANVTFQKSFGSTTNILVETVTIAGCSDARILKFYTLQPIVELENFNNCSEKIRIAGTLDFDGIIGTNSLIDTTFIAKLYADDVYISDLTLSQYGAKYRFDYLWETPIVGTSSLKFECATSYGNYSTTKQILPIMPSTVINQIVPSEFISNYNNIYIVSANSIQLSSSILDVATNQIIIETENSINVAYSNSSSAIIGLKKDILYNIKSIITTNGGCQLISDYITIIRTDYSQKITNVASVGCSNSLMSVAGYIGKLRNITGNYDSSATPNILITETINSDVYELPSNTLIYSVSADSLNNYQDVNSIGFVFDYYPSIGTSSIQLSSNSSLFNSYTTSIVIPTIVSAQAVNLTAASTTIAIGNSLSIGIQDYSNLASCIIYANDNIIASSFTTSWIPMYPGIYNIVAKTKNINGCLINSNILTITVTSMPVGVITTPANNSYIMSETQFDVSVLTSPSYYGSISAVEFYDSTNTLIDYGTNIGNVWTITGVSNISGVYAKIYDTSLLSATTNNIHINLIMPTTTTISASSASYNMYDNVVVAVSGYSPNTGISTIEIYEVVGTSLVYISATNSELIIPASIFGQGNHTLRAKSIDYYGAYSYSQDISFSVIPASKNTFPKITYVSSNPETKISEYGNEIVSIFTISDNSYGILSASIGVDNGTVKSITSLNGQNKYQIEVGVSGTCNLTVSATNKLNNTKTETIYNYIFSCQDNRDINLTNYIPNHLAFDDSGNTSEFFTLTKFYEYYLNTLYTNLDEPCSIGVLEKTSRLRNLHDPDKMELDYIQYFANYLGYNVDVNKAELGGFTTSPNSSSYNDGPDNSEIFSEYQKKALRFVVRNLPNWYSIKTTRNSIKMLLLSFGIFGDLLEVYTNDYTNDWFINSIPPGTYVADDMIIDRYPTPHMFVEIDINSTNLNYIYGSEQNLTSLYKSFDSIRPANVVFEGILGKTENSTQPIYTVNAACMMEKDYFISNL